MCTNRIFVHERVYDDFVQRLRKRIEALKVGDGSQDGVDQVRSRRPCVRVCARAVPLNRARVPRAR